MYPFPVAVWLIVLAGVSGTVLLLGAGLRRAGNLRLGLAAGTGWAAWALVIALLANAGAFRLTPHTANPLIGVAALGGTAIALGCTGIPAITRILSDPAAPWRLTAPHILRVTGGTVFLTAFALGSLPAIFALPAGLGDLGIGLEAIVLSRMLRRGSVGRGALLWFNILGTLDLVTAMTLGFLAAPGPTRIITVTPTTAANGLLPLVLIPTVIVPIMLTLHIVSLSKMRAAVRDSRRPGRTAAPSDYGISSGL
ncbi:hypothetical protein ACFVUS_05455 [Nocardia sp. NPDC058058]|uniref:hypothetical protein n=1 Tax=Nocardia sp. NPDC058058 TaxID=3346317 RepID=UPI0036DAAF14